MKTFLLLISISLVVLIAPPTGVAQPSEVVEGGAWVPATTSDGHYPEILVEYSFTFSPGGLGPPENRAQEAILDIMAVNADGIVSSKVLVYLFRRVSELTLADLGALLEPSPSDNHLTWELREHLHESEGLEDVAIREMQITVE